MAKIPLKDGGGKAEAIDARNDLLSTSDGRKPPELQIVKLRRVNDGRLLHAHEISDVEEAKRYAAEILSSLDMMQYPPKSAELREFFGAELWASIEALFAATLTPEAREESPFSPETAAALNDFLISEYLRLGWRLFLCPEVLALLAHWELCEADRLEQLGKAMVRHKKFLRGEKGGRIPVHGPILRELLKRHGPEVNVLLARWRETRKPTRKVATNKDFADFVTAQVQSPEGPHDYPHLSFELRRMVRYILTRPRDFAASVAVGKTQGHGFLHHWIAEVTGYSVRDIRRKIAKSK